MDTVDTDLSETVVKQVNLESMVVLGASWETPLGG
jgi:hypothetical protein